MFSTRVEPAAVAVRPTVGWLTCAAIAAQVAYPLVHGVARDRLTVVSVVLFAAAAVAHAVTTRGTRVGGSAVAAIFVVGLAAEYVGVHTGVPFGSYRYAGGLSVEVGGVPLVVGLAWIMLGWPSALVARRLVSSFATRVIVGAWALASWDLFLDPQMVAAGHWRWADPDPHLPGVGNVPLSDYAGWLIVSLVVSLIVQLILSESHVRADDRWMFALYLWTFVASVLAQLAFLGLPAAAGWGALGMGLVAVPLAYRLWTRR